MYRTLIFGLLILQAWFLPAQNKNLIYNGSFEKYAHCPDNYGRFDAHNVFGWSSPNWGTPDYFNVCSEKCGVPFNWVGNADAFHGNAYVGIIACMQQLDQNQIPYREYLKVRLSQPLDSGKMYYASMQVRLGLSCNTACNGLGMYFSEIPMQSVRNSNFPVLPQITKSNDPIITEQEQWVQVCGTFKATGNERYLLIGNFWSNQDMAYKALDENLIQTLSVNPIAYYYVDFIELYAQNSDQQFYCEEAEATVVKNFEDRIPASGRLLLKHVNFEHDKATLLAESYGELNRLAATLHRQRNVRISINGHTDNTGTSAYNQELSLQRAKAVQYYLLERGVSRFLLEIRGYGNTMPIAGNKTEEGRSANRRVEIEVLD